MPAELRLVSSAALRCDARSYLEPLRPPVLTSRTSTSRDAVWLWLLLGKTLEKKRLKGCFEKASLPSSSSIGLDKNNYWKLPAGREARPIQAEMQMKNDVLIVSRSFDSSAVAAAANHWKPQQSRSNTLNINTLALIFL